MKYQFVITGLTPLLMSCDDVDMRDMLEKWRKDPKNKSLSKPGDDRTPPWTWQTRMYHDTEHIVVPGDNLWTCFREAATSVTLKGNKSFKESAAAGIFIEQEQLPVLVNGRPIAIASLLESREKSFADQCKLVKSLGFRLFVKTVRIGQAKHIRVRPRFDSWELRGTMLVTADELTLDVLNMIGEVAGHRKGLCDGRPSSRKPWPYGQFSIAFERV